MATASAQPAAATRWGLIAGLAALGLAALYFLHANATRYLTYDPAVFGDQFWPRRFGLMPHLLGGGIALVSGLAQLWLGLTGRTGPLHRAVGKFYMGGVAIGCVGGYYLSFTAVDPPGWSYRVGLFFLTFAWTLTTAVAYLAIRNRRVAQHREWMIRSYAVTFAFVTFRLLDRILGAWGVGPDDDRQRLLIWLCWSVPLLVTGVAVELVRMRRPIG